LFIAAMRALPIGLAMLAFGREMPKGRWRWRSLALGFFNIGIFFALLFLAAARLPGGVAATVGAIQPLLVALMVWGIFAERPSIRTFMLASVGIAGVACLVLSSRVRLDLIGIIAATAAAGAMALGTVLTKRWGRPVPLFTFTSWQLVSGGAFLLPVALVVEGVPPSITFLQALGFVYLAVINTGVAYAIWFRGIERLPTTLMPFLGLLSPLMAFGIGYAFLQQTLTWPQGAGVALVLASVILSQTGKQRAPLKAFAAP
jgi:probable blue pigment (indigoidine) exporter